MQVIDTVSDRESEGRERAARSGVALGAGAFDFSAAHSEGCESSGTGNSRPSGVIGPRRNDSGESLLTRKQFSSGTRSRVGGTLGPTPQRCLTGRVSERARRYKKGAAKPGICLVRFVGGGERSGAVSSRAGRLVGDWSSVRLVSWRAWSAAREGASSKATDRDGCGWSEVRSVSGGVGPSRLGIRMAALRSRWCPSTKPPGDDGR